MSHQHGTRTWYVSSPPPLSAHCYSPAAVIYCLPDTVTRHCHQLPAHPSWPLPLLICPHVSPSIRGGHTVRLTAATLHATYHIPALYLSHMTRAHCTGPPALRTFIQRRHTLPTQIHCRLITKMMSRCTAFSFTLLPPCSHLDSSRRLLPCTHAPVFTISTNEHLNARFVDMFNAARHRPTVHVSQ
jgi:hypothetical protein